MESSETCKSNLCFFSVSVQDFLEKAKKVFLELGESSRLLNPIALKIQGLNRFGSRVLFCDFDKDTKERLRFLAKHIGQTFYDNQLTESKNVKNYNPHVTVMKMSKVRKKKRLIDREVFECAKKTEIGVVHDAVSIDLVSVNRKAGMYYPILKKLEIHESK